MIKKTLFNMLASNKRINYQVLSMIILTCCRCITSSTNDNLQEYDYEQKLRQDLRNNSEIYILPPHSATSPVKVAIDLLIIALRDLDEKTESLTLDAWLKMRWQDTRLSWDETMYGGLKSVRLPYHDTWHPDIKLYNRVKLSEVDTQKDVFSVVQSEGVVEYFMPGTFTSSCSIDLKFYPFDVQKCVLRFGSWNHNGHHIEMEQLRPEGTLESSSLFNENNQWEIVNNRSWKNVKYYACCEEPFSDISFELHLRRRSPYYKYIILFPTLGVAVLTLAIFWLPSMAVDKLILSGTCFLSLVIILLHLSLKLPPAGRTVPMIVILCGHLTLMVVVSTLMSIISIVWSRTEYNRQPPKWLMKFSNSVLGKICCTTSPTYPMSANHHDECNSLEMDGDDIKNIPGEKDRMKYYTSQWIQCFQLFDRITFVLMSILMSFALAGSFTFHQ